MLKTSTKIPNLIRETLQRTEKKIVAEIKQNNAAKRRNRILSNKEAISRKANQLKTKRSAKILLSKYEQAKHMEQKAFETKLINQEKVMLAKVSANNNSLA